MRAKSEIFDEYARIAEEHGLISKEGQVRNKKVRNDSVDISDIGLLYGVVPEGNEENVIDRAHPETVVVAPAYDAMNGVVENLRERQDIMSWVALKNPDGLLTQRRYVAAHNDLMQSVVKIGFVMDNNDEEGLTKLADSCAERLHKQALGPWAIAGIGVGIAAALGVGYYFTQMPVSVQNVHANSELVLKRIPANAPYGVDLTNLINKIENTSNQLLALSIPLGQMYRNMRAALAEKDVVSVKEIYQNSEEQRNTALALISEINKQKGLLLSFKIDVENAKGMGSDYIGDIWQKGWELIDWVYQSEEESLPGALDALAKAIDNLVKGMSNTLNQAKQFAGKIETQLQPAPKETPDMPDPLAV